jgi:hypothetical protein
LERGKNVKRRFATLAIFGPQCRREIANFQSTNSYKSLDWRKKQIDQRQ